MLRRIVGLAGALGLVAGCASILGDFSTAGVVDGVDGGNGGNGDGAAPDDGGGGLPDVAQGDAADAADAAPVPGCSGPGALVCGAHQACVAGPKCECVTGYSAPGPAAGDAGEAGAADAGGAAGACTWAGLPLDPGLNDHPPKAWTIANGTYAPTASVAGQLDPGNVSFVQAQICPSTGAGRGIVQQKLTMPSYAEAEPFALRLSGAATCSGQDCGSQGIGFDFNGGYIAESMGATPTPVGLCLGERAYGGSVTLTLSPWGDACGAADATYTALIDHADIEPAKGCPVPGTITNADFETANGWAISPAIPPTSTSQCQSFAEIAAGDGTNGTRGGKLLSTCEGFNPQVSEPVSIPYKNIPNLALQMDFANTNGAADLAAGLDVSFAGHSLGNMWGTGQRTGKICVPAWAKGLAETLSIDLPFAAYGFHGTASYEYRSFTFDNLAWVSDPTCPADALDIDPGFERADPGRAWQLGISHDFNVNPKAEIVADPSAHGGANSLHLNVAVGSSWARANTTVTIPAPDAGGGPQLTAWYKMTSTTQATLGSTFGSSASAAAWTRLALCLDPHAAGHAFDVRFELDASGAANAALSPVVDAYVDDVVVGTAAACPSQ